jgi:hypothetical protein
MVQEEGLYVCNIHNIAGKHLSINIALVRSRGWALVNKKRSPIKNGSFSSFKRSARNQSLSNLLLHYNRQAYLKYDWCMFIRYLVSMTQVLKDNLG